MEKLKAGLIANGIEGLDKLYQSNAQIDYELLPVGGDFNPDLEPFDLLIAPNGTDHVAMYRIRKKVQEFLAQGKTLFCFDGWFTDWVPGNRWIMDNSKKTIDIRYSIRDDHFGLAHAFNIKDLNFSHGISGWWACGYIVPAAGASVLIEDTWQRPLVVLDDDTTNGLMVLSASGPLADLSYATTDDEKSYRAMAQLYQSLLRLVQKRKIAQL